MSNRNNKKMSIFFLSLALGLLFIASDNTLLTHLSLNFHFKKIITIFISFMCISLIMLINNNIKIDNVSVFLLLRIPYYLFHPIIYQLERESFAANYLIVILAPFCYIAMRSLKFDIKPLLKIIVGLIILIVFIQLTEVHMNLLLQNALQHEIKSQLQIPMGNSNYVAAVLLLCCFISYYLFDSKWIFILSIISIILTLSNGAILVVLLGSIYIFIHDRKFKANNLFRNMVLILAIASGIYFMINSMGISFERYQRLFNLFSDDGASANNIYTLFNGRDKIFENALSSIFKGPLTIFFGYGIGNFVIDDFEIVKVHNWILQGLLNGGILGLSINFIPVILFLFNVDNIKINRGIHLAILLSLIYGLIEPNFYTAVFEMLFWIFCGFFSSRNEGEI